MPILDVSNPYQSDFIVERTEEVQLHGEFGILTGTIGYYDEYFKSPPSVGFDTVQYVLVPFGGPIRAFAIGNSKNTSKAGYRSEEHTSELQSLMRISYAFFCLK